MKFQKKFNVKSTIFVGLATALVLALVLPATTLAAPFNYGDVFCGVGNGKIRHYDSAGNFIEDLDTGTGSNEQTGMAFDAAGNLYATSFTTSQVTKFDNNGILLGLFGGGYNCHPESIVLDGAGDLYIGQADCTRRVLKFDSAGAFLDFFTPATEHRGTDWIELASDQTTLFYTSEGSRVKRFDLIAKMQLPDFATGLPGSSAFALRILPDGGVLVANWQLIVRLDSSGNVIDTYDIITENAWFALNLDPDGTSFWSAGYDTGNVYKFDIETGTLLLTINTKADGPVTTLAGLAVYGERTGALGSISGTKFDDVDGDGVWDADEPGLAGWEIELRDSTGGLVATIVTDDNGNYVFASLPDDIYVVSEVPQAGWIQTAPATGTYTEDTTGGLDLDGRDFGNRERPLIAELCPDDYAWASPPPGFEWDPFPLTFRSWLNVHFVNQGGGDAFGVAACVTCVPLNTVPIAPYCVHLGDIPAGGGAWSQDSFTLELDMTDPQPSDRGICWTVEYDDAAGVHHIVEDVAKYCGEKCSDICP